MLFVARVKAQVGVAIAVAVFALACHTKRSPADQPGEPSGAPPVAASISPPGNPYLTNPTADAASSVPGTVTVAMALPQPLIEPTPDQDPSQYAAANPPWPTDFTEVYGSELVSNVKRAAQTKGTKGVLINAWASWCGPCKTEMPMLLKMRERYAKQGIEVWFVSVDKSDQAEQTRAVLQELGIEPPHYVVKGRLGYFKEALSPIWKGSLPSTFLFDAQGRVRYYWGAHVYENELVPLLEDFLAGKLVDGMANFKVRRGPATISP